MRNVLKITIAAALLSPLTTITAAQNQPLLAFEVATIKLQDPRTLRMGGGSCHGKDSVYPPNAVLVPPRGRCQIVFGLASLIAVAYSPVAPVGGIWRTAGGPAWVNSDLWLIEGKAENTDAATEAQLKQMLQMLLAERFKLKFHYEMKDVPGFALVVSKGGLKIKEDTAESGNEPLMSAGPAGLIYRKALLSMFANYLSGPTGEPVIDKTGLTGRYSFTFQPPRPQPVAEPGNTDPGPSIFTAIQEQLGLRLESAKVPASFLVIDHAERPTPD